jgi:ADP-ribose pyrophosphatase YjhB (NUDIX family)
LKPKIPKFKELWDEYRLYMSQIPSNGALIFNKNLDKLLFIVYHNPRERIVRKLDFPKGKVDQGEQQVECALREIREETGLHLE